MAQRILLGIGAEFLRVLLRQLLRRQVGAEIFDECDSLAAALLLRGANSVIVDVAACVAAPSAMAEICRRYPGRVILIGEGAGVPLPRGLRLRDVTLVPTGTASSQLDLPIFTARLDEVLSRFRTSDPPPMIAATEVPNRERLEVAAPLSGRAWRPVLIAIAASTGGPEALQELLAALDPPICPIVIALHVPREHSAGMASHLAKATGHPVMIGEAGPLPANRILLLQGGVDHAVAASPDGLCLRRVRGHVSVFHPNGSILLGSAASLDLPVVGIVLTGMGNDGCVGARQLVTQGHPVLAQQPSTCAVPGMPNAAIAAGAVTEVASLAGIAARLNGWFAMPATE
jgi:two-component system chemotaxis response regulator CheB